MDTVPMLQVPGVGLQGVQGVRMVAQSDTTAHLKPQAA